MRKAITRVLLGSILMAVPAITGLKAQSSSTVADRLLKPLYATMRLLQCEYRDAVMGEPRPFINDRLVNGDAEWSCKVKTDPVQGDRDAINLTITFRLERGTAKSSGIAVAFDFSDWSADNYVMIPAVVYNGNRNRIVIWDYAAGLGRDDLYRQDLPLTTTGLPQLSPEPGKLSRIEVSSCNATTPAICLYEKETGREGYDEFPEITLTRKNGDVLFWMIKQFELLKAQGKASAISPVWEKNIYRLAQAFARTWNRYGQWGNFVNINTGEIAVFNSTSGASAIGGMALASRYYRNPEFLRIAVEAAGYYYNRDFVALGMTTGACADILQNADSESAAGLMTSLMVLYEVTGDVQWLEKSRNLANLLATWTVSYDYKLPPETELAQLGARLAGVVWASTQNKHGAPGICTSSGDPLFKIFRATGDRRYADLMHDIVHAWAEGVQPNGWITERLTYCDADSRGSRGTGGKTGWNELNGILMAMELPGIYLQTDREVLCVFDHVEAEVLKRSPEGVELSITNPTKYDASVSIFSESSAAAKKPLGMTGFLKWPKVTVKAGRTDIFIIGRKI